MEETKFIFVIDAEKHYNILVRIITILNRLRIPINEFNSVIKDGENILRVSFIIKQNKEAILKLSKKLDKEVDVISVNVFEQLDNLPFNQFPVTHNA